MKIHTDNTKDELFKVLYKKSLLAVGNPNSSTGLCTLWSEKERVLEKVSSNNFNICGQCYSSTEGVNIIIRNMLANKKLSRLVLTGADLSGAGDVLLSLKEHGIDNEYRVIGFPDTKIDSEIPMEAIERFRKNVEIIDKRDIKDYSELDKFLSTLENKEGWGEPEFYEMHKIQTPEQFSSEKTGFVIRGKKVGDVWLKILDTIFRFGYKKKSQYADDQLEIVSLISVISNEDPENIDWKPYFKFSEKHFKEYLPQLMSSEIFGDVNYTYGSKLRNFKGINQIESIVNQLKEALYTRRAVAVTFDVEHDFDNPHSPCLDLIQVLVQDKLYLTAYFRSNDMFGAWPENALALRNVQSEIAKRIGVPMGDLIIMSNSAHIYSSNWNEAKEILKKYPPVQTWDMSSRGERESDPRGNILVELENSMIKVTHLDARGNKIEEFYADNAVEVYKKITERQMISQVSHALDIGMELGKAESALIFGKKYVQDKALRD